MSIEFLPGGGSGGGGGQADTDWVEITTAAPEIPMFLLRRIGPIVMATQPSGIGYINANSTVNAVGAIPEEYRQAPSVGTLTFPYPPYMTVVIFPNGTLSVRSMADDVEDGALPMMVWATTPEDSP